MTDETPLPGQAPTSRPRMETLAAVYAGLSPVVATRRGKAIDIFTLPASKNPRAAAALLLAEAWDGCRVLVLNDLGGIASRVCEEHPDFELRDEAHAGRSWGPGGVLYSGHGAELLHQLALKIADGRVAIADSETLQQLEAVKFVRKEARVDLAPTITSERFPRAFAAALAAVDTSPPMIPTDRDRRGHDPFEVLRGR